MPFTPDEIARLAVVFPRKHIRQINAKAAKNNIPPEDVGQDVSVIILEKAADFDPKKGTLPQFIFGHWEKRMLGQTGAHRQAISLDRDDPVGEAARHFANAQTVLAVDDSNEITLSLNPQYLAEILSIAGCISGKSCADFALSRGVTPRYVRRALQTLRETGKIPPLLKDGWKRKRRPQVHPAKVGLTQALNNKREENQARCSNSRCNSDNEASVFIPECSVFE